MDDATPGPDGRTDVTHRAPGAAPGAFALALSAGLILGSAPAAEAQAGPSPAPAVVELAPTDPAWQFRGDVRPGRHADRDAFLLRTGSAHHRDLVFTEGTVAFEVSGTEERAFLGVLLRRGPDGDAENVYLRLHKSRLPDAVQYTPSYRGQGQWQLYHGPSATARARFTPGAWQPVRIEVRGSQAAVFVGKGGTPRLVVDRLHTGRASGGLVLWANQPGADADAPLTAAVSRLRVLPDSTTYDFPPPSAGTALPGAIRAWGLSPSFPVEVPDAGGAPPEIAPDRWRTVQTDATGLLPLDRHLDRAEGGAGSGALAALRLTADRERTVRLKLGYSDNVTVFLNGRPLVTGRFPFSHNFPRRQGLLTPDQATVYLRLRPGTNQLLLLVSETAFGGWGLLGRIEDRTGLTVAPWDGGPS